jgi:DNA mismatch endonuclease (patch repair protein)
MEKLLRETLVDGKFGEVKPVHSKMMKAVKRLGNKTTEIRFCSALNKAGISGWQVHEKLIGNPDIFFPVCKVAIFLDGCFWHACPQCGHIPKTNTEYWRAKLKRNVDRDIAKAGSLVELGFKVIRFWEHELLQHIDNCIAITKDCLEENLIKISNATFYNQV